MEERGGFIWLFYEGPKGNRLPADERPPIPCIPELDDPNWTPVYGELEFDCGHWAVFENAIDMAHIHYLHNDSFGNDDKPVVMNMEGRLYLDSPAPLLPLSPQVSTILVWILQYILQGSGSG